MKKLLVLAMIFVLDVAVGPAACRKNHPVVPPMPDEHIEESAPTETPTPTVAPTEAITPTAEPEVTDAPDITDEPAVTEEPENVRKGEDAIYEDIIGTWYLYSSEIEGYERLATEENENISVTFEADNTATLDAAYYYGRGEEPYTYQYSGAVNEMPEACVWGKWLADFGVEDCTYYYSMNDDGNLVQMCDIIYEYEGYETLSYSIYVREQQVFAPQPRVVPEKLQAIMDNALENNWITVVYDPDPELKAALDEGGWTLDDETENEWLAYPITRPVELIVCNTSDSYVNLQIHEPRSDYDPKSDDKAWIRGPFMYYDYLAPGEISRFIVDMPDDSRDATMALYMEFEDDEDDDVYYNRIYKYDDPYFYFDD